MGFLKYLTTLAVGILTLFPTVSEADSGYASSGSDYPLVDLVGDYYSGGNSSNSILCEYAADETGCNIAFNIGFDFEWHGETFTHGLMSTNGCLKLLKSSAFSDSDYCTYDINHLSASSGMNDTLFPFWADLDLGTIYDTQAPYNSTMLFNNTGNFATFGWYYMREYGVTADTDKFNPQYPNAHNTFEVVLLNQNCADCPGEETDTNDDYAYIYGNLEINHSNVLIGEKKNEDNFTEAYFFSDNSYCADCVNPDDGTLGRYLFIWDDYDNGTLEGGAIYKDGNGIQPTECESDPLYSTSCSLYSVTYLAQQCEFDSSYSPDCAGYFVDLDDKYADQEACYNDPNLPECAALGIFDTTTQYDYATGNMGPYFNPNDFGNMDGYDPNTGLVTQSDGSQISIQGDYYSDGYDPNMDYNSMNSNEGDDFYMDSNGVYVPDQYDPLKDDDIQYEYLNEEQKMLVDQGLSPQEATLITMGTEDIIALGHDPGIQFNGNNPGDFVIDKLGGLENYDLDLHDDAMQAQANANGFEDNYIDSDIWATEEYMLQEKQWEAEFEAEFGVEAYSWTSKEWYDYDVKTAGQDQVDEWYGKDVVFDERGEMQWESFDMMLDEDYAYEVYEVYSDEEDLMYENMIANDIQREKCPTCELEEFFDLSDDELIAFENERMYEEEAYFDLDPKDAFEAFIKEEGLEDILSADELDQFRNDVYADMEQHEEQHTEQYQEGPGDYQVADSSTPKAQEQRQEQQQQKTDSQFLNNAGSGVMSVSVAEFNLDFNSGDGGSTQEVVEELIADIIDDGSSSFDDGSGSFDDGSGSSNDGSGSSNDGSSQSQNSDGSQDSGQGMLAQEDTSGDSFFQEQIEQSMGQESFDATDSTTDTVDTGAFEVADSFADAQTEQQEETLQFVENFDDGTSGISGADIQFEDELTTALSSGTGLTEFLSQAPADYSRFEVEAPTFQEQRQSDAVESLADTMGASVAAANLQAELDTIQAGNEGSSEYGDQTIAVAYIGYTAGFSQYTSQIQLADQQAWYGNSQVYKGQKNVDNVASFYMMAGNTQVKLKEMIYSQYKDLKEKETTEK